MSDDNKTTEKYQQHLAFKIRLNPRKSQHRKLFAALEHTRLLQNAALENRNSAYARERKMFDTLSCSKAFRDAEPKDIWAHIRQTCKTVDYYHQLKQLTELRQSDPLEWAKYPVTLQRWPLKQIDMSYKQAWAKLKKGQRPQFPKFKGREYFKTFGFTDKSGWGFKKNRLYIKNIGYIRYHSHRPLSSDPVSLEITLDRPGVWVAHVVCKVDKQTDHSGTPIGLDLGVANLATLSNGKIIPNAMKSDHAERKRKAVRRQERKLARAKKGSKNRRKVKKTKQRLSRKISDYKHTALHQASCKLARHYKTIVIEDLTLRNMTKSAKGTIEEPGTQVAQKTGLNRSLHDAGLGIFVGMLAYKVEKAGGDLIKVNPQYTSQTCAMCEHVSPNSRKSQARFECVSCGHTDHADINAAINIARRGGVAVPGAYKRRGCPSVSHGNTGSNDLGTLISSSKNSFKAYQLEKK